MRILHVCHLTLLARLKACTFCQVLLSQCTTFSNNLANFSQRLKKIWPHGTPSISRHQHLCRYSAAATLQDIGFTPTQTTLHVYIGLLSKCAAKPCTPF